MKIQEQATDILIEGLEVFCHIGVPEEERRHPQMILVDVTCHMGTHMIQQDRLEETVNYAMLVDRIQALAQANVFVLVETLARHIADLGFEDERVLSVEVTVRKPHRLSGCAAVGVKRVFVRVREEE